MSAAKRKNIKLWALNGLWILAVGLLQDTLFARLPIAGVSLYPLPMAVACTAMFYNAKIGGIFGLCVGTLLALTGQSGGGAVLLAMAVAGAFSGWLCDAVLNRSLPTSLAVAFLTELAVLLSGALLHSLFHGSQPNLLRMILRQTFFTLPLCPGLYYVSRAIRKAGAEWIE